MVPARQTTERKIRHHVARTSIAVVLGAVAAVATLSLGGHLAGTVSRPRSANAAVLVSSTRRWRASGSHRPSATSGYLAEGGASVLFVQWTDESGQLAGSIQVSVEHGLPPTQEVLSQTFPVSGRIRGSQITLRFGYGPTYVGVVASHRFTVEMLETGALAKLTFREVTTSTYSTALGQFRALVENADTAAATLQGKRALQAAIATTAKELDSVLATINNVESSIGTSEAAVAGALQAETARLSVTEQAEETVLSETSGTPGSVCTAARRVAHDSDAVDDGAVKVADALDQLKSELTGGLLTTGLSTLIGLVATAERRYQAAVAVLPTTAPRSIPSATAVQQVLASATAGGASAVSTVNGYISQANGDVTAGIADADAALSAGNCGTSQPAMAPIPTLKWDPT